MNKRTNSSKAPSRPSQIWWVYFGFLLVMGVVGVAPYFTLVRQSQLSGGQLAVPIAATLLSLWGLVGLWGYILSRRLGWSGLWQACVGFTVIQWIYAASCFVGSLSQASGATPWVPIFGIAGMLAGLPLILALWRYAFLSPQVWGR